MINDEVKPISILTVGDEVTFKRVAEAFARMEQQHIIIDTTHDRYSGKWYDLGYIDELAFVPPIGYKDYPYEPYRSKDSLRPDSDWNYLKLRKGKY